MTDTTVLIVGAGVAGCAIARELAPDHDVLVVDKGAVASEATALAAGEITMTPSYSDLPSVAAHANDFFRSYDGTGEFGFEERPSLELVLEGRAEVARRRVRRLREDHGLDVDFLEVDQIADRYEWVSTDPIDGGIAHRDTGFVDPYTFAVTLMHDAIDDGARFETETPVESILVEDDAVVGVETADGTHTADTVVAAAGWRTESLLGDVLQIPVRPYRTQCVVLEADDPLDDSFPMGWIPGEHVYYRPELNGDLLVGGWSFATDDPEGASSNADEAFREHVAEIVPTYFGGLSDLRFVNGWAGVDGATPDTRPIIDAPADAPDGLVVATGFHGRGVMTSPIAATLVRRFVAEDPSPIAPKSDDSIPAEPFALDRFDDRSPDFEFTSISSGDDDYDEQGS
ncbi:MAG: NAD(P)/FAD-dependent oxidoreductase [Halobacteriota archaeon]